jgi:hypothetical protein
LGSSRKGCRRWSGHRIRWRNWSLLRKVKSNTCSSYAT